MSEKPPYTDGDATNEHGDLFDFIRSSYSPPWNHIATGQQLQMLSPLLPPLNTTMTIDMSLYNELMTEFLLAKDENQQLRLRIAELEKTYICSNLGLGEDVG